MSALVRTNTLSTLKFILRDLSLGGAVIDLTGTTVNLRYRIGSGVLKTISGITITDAVNGKCQYTFTYNDLDTVGLLVGDIQIVKGTNLSKTLRFYVDILETATGDSFQEGFEEVFIFLQIFAISRWHSFVLIPSQSQPNIVQSPVHSGLNAIQFTCVKKTTSTIPKSHLIKTLFSFHKHDTVLSTIWYYIVSQPSVSDLYLWDLEDTAGFSQGRRIYIRGDQCIGSDGKTLAGAVFAQTPGQEITVPLDQWFEIKIYLYLSDGDDGIMRVYQNGVKIIEGLGKNLPNPDSVYDSIQLGITANSNTSYNQTVYVDDFSIQKV